MDDGRNKRTCVCVFNVDAGNNLFFNEAIILLVIG